ncbi:unnamed protein product [Sympodiomycopsis kandeliae]
MPLGRDLSWQNIKNAASGKLHASSTNRPPSGEARTEDPSLIQSDSHPSSGDISTEPSTAFPRPLSRDLSGASISTPKQISGGSGDGLRTTSSHLLVPGSTPRASEPGASGGSSGSPSTSPSSTQLANLGQPGKESNRSKPLALLRIQVVKAADLAPKDRNGKADPFVTVSIPGLAVLARRNGLQGHNLEQRFRKQTAVINKNLNPEWKNEIFDFEITEDWLGPDGWQEDLEESATQLEDPTSEDVPVEIPVAVQDTPAEALRSRTGSGMTVEGQSGASTPLTETSAPPSRPQSRRKISQTASKVLQTGAKGVMLLPKGAAAGARVVARGTPRPLRLRRGGAGPSGARRIATSRAGFVSNLEIVVWDKDFARREYMGEVSWPIWEWCRGPRAVTWDEQDPQQLEPAWLPLVSSRQNTAVTGKVQVRIGLVGVPGSPVTSLDRLYRALVASAVGAGNRLREGSGDDSPTNPSNVTEDEILAGVRAIPAAQSVGTAENFFADDGFSSESDGEEQEELLDSDIDSELDDDEDADTSETDADDIGSTEEGTDAEDATGHDLIARHRQRLAGLKVTNDKADSSTSGSPAQAAAHEQPEQQSLAAKEPPQRRRILGGLGKKSNRSREQSGSAEDRKSSLPAGEGQSRLLNRRNLRGKITRKKHRHQSEGTDELTPIPGETKEERKQRKQALRASRRGKANAARHAKRERKMTEQDYSFQTSEDIVGIVMMEVKEARELPRWKNSLRTGFDMDPFTIVAFGHKIFRTRVLRHTLNPVWNEKLLFHVRPHEMNFSIKMSIYDWDKISANDHVGSCELPLQTLLDAAPKPDEKTGLYDSRGDVINQMQTLKLPLSRLSKDEDVKYGDATPNVTVQAKFTPYAALRQRFWRQLCQQFDTNDSESISALELTTMLDSLGSTLTTETIHSFFTRYGKNPETDAVTFDEAILALEEEVRKPSTEKRRVRSASGSPGPDNSGSQTPALASVETGDTGSAMDPTGPSAPPATNPVADAEPAAPVPSGGWISDGSVQPATTSSAVAHTITTGIEQSSDSDRKEEPMTRISHGPSPATEANVDLRDRPVERVILLKSCPLCHMPRLSKKGDGDVVTHLAICASQDWRRVDSLVVSNFVTASQAHRKWFNKIVITATQGRYKLGANSSNIIVQDRETGELLEEKMQVYVRLGIRLLYQGARSRMEGARIRRMLQNMSYKQGRKYDSPASAREIPGFIAFHNLDVDEIRDPLDSFKTFNEFFYRKLKPDARPVDEPENPNRVVSAADCRLMVFENIEAATKIWIKGREFSVERLLGDRFADKLDSYKNGSLCIFRLAPQDYHRFHCPADGVIGEPFMIEGSYYTVNPVAIRSAIDVYCENVRVVVPLHTKEYGTIYTVHIGAMLVGSIKITVKAGQSIKKGDELGYYAFGGSTTVLVFEKDRVEWDEDILMNSNASIETLIKQGRGIGRALSSSDERLIEEKEAN